MKNKNLYLLSANPMHVAHFNTWETAQQRFEESTVFCIVQNPFKSDGLFTLGERANIANKFFGIPKKEIVLLDTKEKVSQAIQNAPRIIRGVRNQEDREHNQKLARFYGVENYLHKLHEILVPNKFLNVSSASLIDLIQRGKYSFDLGWVPDGLVNLIKEKIDQMKANVVLAC